MSEPTAAPGTFVPVSETLRARGARQWLGEHWPRADLLWLLAITGLGGVLRLYRIEQWSLSADEAATWRAATEAVAASGGPLTTVDGFAPLGPFWLRLLLESGVLPFHGEGWLRLPFGFAGLLAVPLLALVGDLFVGRRPALFAAALLAIHPWHVHASQTAAPAAVAVLFALFAVGALWVACRMDHAPSRALAAACAALAGLVHPSGWLPALALSSWYVAAGWRASGGGARLLLVALPGAVGFAAWCWAADRLGLLGAPGWWRGVELGLGIGAGLGVPAVLFAVAATWLGGAPAAASATAAGVRGRPGGLLVAAVLGPALLPPVGAALGLPAAVDHALPALPWTLLLASAAAVRAATLAREALGRTRRSAAALAAALLPAALAVGYGADTYLQAAQRAGLRSDWRTGATAVMRASARAPGFTVLAGEGFGSLLYYLRPDHWRDPVGDPHPNRAVVRVAAWPAALAREVAAAGDGELFVVASRDEVVAAEADPAAAALLGKSFRLVAVLPLPLGRRDATVYVWRRIGRE